MKISLKWKLNPQSTCSQSDAVPILAFISATQYKNVFTFCRKRKTDRFRLPSYTWKIYQFINIVIISQVNECNSKFGLANTILKAVLETVTLGNLKWLQVVILYKAFEASVRSRMGKCLNQSIVMTIQTICTIQRQISPSATPKACDKWIIEYRSINWFRLDPSSMMIYMTKGFI